MHGRYVLVLLSLIACGAAYLIYDNLRLAETIAPVYPADPAVTAFEEDLNKLYELYDGTVLRNTAGQLMRYKSALEYADKLLANPLLEGRERIRVLRVKLEFGFEYAHLNKVNETKDAEKISDTIVAFAESLLSHSDVSLATKAHRSLTRWRVARYRTSLAATDRELAREQLQKSIPVLIANGGEANQIVKELEQFGKVPHQSNAEVNNFLLETGQVFKQDLPFAQSGQTPFWHFGERVQDQTVLQGRDVWELCTRVEREDLPATEELVNVVNDVLSSNYQSQRLVTLTLMAMDSLTRSSRMVAGQSRPSAIQGATLTKQTDLLKLAPSRLQGLIDKEDQTELQQAMQETLDRYAKRIAWTAGDPIDLAFLKLESAVGESGQNTLLNRPLVIFFADDSTLSQTLAKDLEMYRKYTDNQQQYGYIVCLMNESGEPKNRADTLKLLLAGSPGQTSVLTKETAKLLCAAIGATSAPYCIVLDREHKVVLNNFSPAKLVAIEE